MKHPKLAIFSLSAVGALALAATAMVGAKANQGNAGVSIPEAISCSTLSSRIAGAERVNSAWSKAIQSWRSGVASNPEMERFNRMVTTQNRTADATDVLIRRYNRQCVGVSMRRSVYDQACDGIDTAFCRGFDF